MNTVGVVRSVALFSLLLAACGSGSSSHGGDAGDLSTDANATFTDGGPMTCKSSSDCIFSGYVCAYSIAQGCAATTGICMPVTSSCDELRILCGCNGQHTEGDGDCKYPQGYASGPTQSLDPSCGASEDGGDSDGGNDGF